MFADGSAYKPIHIAQPQPDVSQITGAVEKPATPLGEPVNRDNFQDEAVTDYSHFDNEMERRINEMRSGNRNMQNNNTNVGVQNNSDYKKLEKRVDLLEQALSLVMSTQKKLIEGK
jgi:hypothetical protein